MAPITAAVPTTPAVMPMIFNGAMRHTGLTGVPFVALAEELPEVSSPKCSAFPWRQCRSSRNGRRARIQTGERCPFTGRAPEAFIRHAAGGA
jgi:hypothetical protein